MRVCFKAQVCACYHMHSPRWQLQPAQRGHRNTCRRRHLLGLESLQGESYVVSTTGALQAVCGTQPS